AVELLDQMLLDLARGNLSLRDTMAAVRGRPAALFMVEFSGDEAAEVADRVERLGRRLREVPGVTALVPALDPALRNPLWRACGASPRTSPTCCWRSAAPSAASTATAWRAANGTARCSARWSTRPSAASSTPSTRTTCSTPARWWTRRR